METMRLLTVGSLPPEWGGPSRGGVATFHASLLSGLLERRDAVEIVGTLPPTPLAAEVPVPIFARPEGIGRAAFYEGLLERLRPDVVLMNHIANTFGVTHARLGSPVPAAGVVHSWHNVTFKPADERESALALTQEAMSGLAAMVVPSRHALAEGRGLGLRYPAIADVIHNPLQPLYMGDDVDVHAHKRRDVLYLGSLIPRKEPAALVEAAVLLPTLGVLLVGEGELAVSLRAQIDGLGLGERVRLAGPLPDADHVQRVRDMLLRARMICLPSRSESFGLVFIEALACGTPIVGFGPTVREIRDEIGIEIGEPLETGTPQEIAAAIERVAAATWDRDLLRRATLDAFGLSKVTDRYVELLSQLVRQPAMERPQPSQ
jgi:glycosyltransferase involved in cell wall biosynthesis